MIIIRTPFRISFFGGGTDFEEFYSETHGTVFVMTISSYMYVILNSKFEGDLRVVYWSMEHATSAASITHGIFREGLRMMGVDTGVEVVSVADPPGRGTGLGSSSALAVGLVNALTNYLGKPLSKEELASKAFERG
ncbi:MAG: hypothetical protein FJ358_08395 [Thaumarchaeota archaeon]|nr:hypothetical protein [Nitrososphaerota archaeon]